MLSSRRTWVKNPKNVYFIGGKYKIKESRKNVLDYEKQTYKDYFGKPIEINIRIRIPNLVSKYTKAFF